MHVVVLVTQKGGSGKTTLATCCAVAAQEKGKRALIIDMDPQGSAEAWYQDREADTPHLVKIEAAELEQALAAARTNTFDMVLIDTPGRDEPRTAAAIRAADLCLIPCRPTPADMKATPATVATITRLNKPAAFVLTQTPPRSFRIREAEQGLSMLGMVAPIRITLRNDFQDAYGRGLGVTEYAPEGKAAQEIRELWSWVAKKVGKVSYARKKNIA
jgi:chromosome partitioning protein